MRMPSAEIPCAEARGLLQLRMDGPLDVRRARDLDAHLEGCDACRSREADLLAVREALRGLPEPRMPGDALEHVWARTVDAASSGARTRRSRAPRRGIWGLALTAAAAALLLVIGLPISGLGPAGPDPRRSEISAEELARAEADLRRVLAVTVDSLESAESAALEEIASGTKVLARIQNVTRDRLLADEVGTAIGHVPLLSPTPLPRSDDASSRGRRQL